MLHVIPIAKKDCFKYCCCCGKKLDYESKRPKKERKALPVKVKHIEKEYFEDFVERYNLKLELQKVDDDLYICASLCGCWIDDGEFITNAYAWAETSFHAVKCLAKKISGKVIELPTQDLKK